jgi:DNA-binding transcriptional LysR family regulator
MTFRAVAHQRSFSAAARQLRLSQPSVSQQVALLEVEVGTKLFDRRPGGLQLTPAGEVLLTHTDAIAQRFDLAATQLAELAHQGREQLRFGSFPTALAGYVPEAIARLRRRHPELRLLVDEVTPSHLEERLLRGDFHVAIGYQQADHERRTFGAERRVELLQEEFLVALPPGHRLADAPKVALRDLAEDDWIVPSTEGFVIEACRAAGFEPHVIAVTHGLAARGMVEQGLAVSMAPSLLAQSFRGVALRPVDGPTPRRDVFAVVPPGGQHPYAEDMVRALVETAREQAVTS